MDINKFKAHLGKEREFKIGEDTFKFKPLTVSELPELLAIIAKFAKAEKPEESFYQLDKDDINTLISLIKKMIIRSYPNIENELGEEGLNEFIANNFFTLITILFEVNSMGATQIKRPPTLNFPQNVSKENPSK